MEYLGNESGWQEPHHGDGVRCKIADGIVGQ